MDGCMYIRATLVLAIDAYNKYMKGQFKCF